MVTEIPKATPDDGTAVKRFDFRNGRENTEMVAYIVAHGGHTCLSRCPQTGGFSDTSAPSQPHPRFPGSIVALLPGTRMQRTRVSGFAPQFVTAGTA